MKKILIVILLFCFIVGSADAVYDPTSKPNNKFGIHILFTSELERAAKLVNSSGGDWGYVTIPIQYGERDLARWQKFMDDCGRLHVIPIVRVATEPYFKNTSVWRTPNDFDTVDFANFLNSLSWPTKNRYVLLFNEVNRFDEWGGNAPSPESYSDFVSDAVDVFKSRSSEFFIIAGGLDNASPNDGVKYLDNFIFLSRMGIHNTDVFKKIDGLSSHSYPNPDFAAAPSKNKQEGTSTYKFEENIVERSRGSTIPVFITETGWNAERLPQSVIASYITTSMKEIWGSDDEVIAVTPFILEAGGGPFDKFTFYREDALTRYGQVYKSLSKTKGDPVKTEAGNYVSKNPEKPRKYERFSLIPADFQNRFTSALLRTYFKSVFAIGK